MNSLKFGLRHVCFKTFAKFWPFVKNLIVWSYGMKTQLINTIPVQGKKRADGHVRAVYCRGNATATTVWRKRVFGTFRSLTLVHFPFLLHKFSEQAEMGKPACRKLGLSISWKPNWHWDRPFLVIKFGTILPCKRPNNTRAYRGYR